MTDIDIQPVPVSLKSSDVSLTAQLPSKPCLETALVTRLVDSTGIIAPKAGILLLQDALRMRAHITVYDAPVVLTADRPAVTPDPTTQGVKPAGYLLAPVSPQSDASSSASGTVTGPAAGTAIATLTGLVPGQPYNVTASVLTSGGTIGAGDNNNMELEPGNLVIVFNHGTQTDQFFGDIIAPANGTLTIQSIGASGANVVYTATITAVPSPVAGEGCIDIEGQNEIWVNATEGVARVSILTERAVNE